MVVDVCKRLAVCEARMSQALSLQAKFVKDIETVKDSAIPGVFNRSHLRCSHAVVRTSHGDSQIMSEFY